MKCIILLAALLSGCASSDYTFVRMKAGVKVQEVHIDWYEGDSTRKSHPIACSVDIGRTMGNWSFGVSHDSQCFDGAPFNNNDEYYKTEVFAAYEVRI